MKTHRKNDFEDATYNAVVDYLYEIYPKRNITENPTNLSVEVFTADEYLSIKFSGNETKMFLSFSPIFSNIDYSYDMFKKTVPRRFFGLENMKKAIDIAHRMALSFSTIEG